VIVYGALLSLLSTSIFAERIPMEPSKLTEQYGNAVPYQVPDSKKEMMDMRVNPLARIGRPPILSYDETIDEYIYWRDDGRGKRIAERFFLANRVKADVTGKVEFDGKKYVYTNTVRVHPTDPRENLLIYIIDVPEHLIDNLTMSEGWSKERNSRGWLWFYNRKAVYVPQDIVISSFQFESEYGPRLINVAGQALPGGTPAQGDEYALGLKGNSVVGQTIGPADEPLNDPFVELDKLLNAAEKWQWEEEASIAKLRQTIEDYDPYKKKLRVLLNELLDLSSAPEMRAMIEELERNI